MIWKLCQSAWNLVWSFPQIWISPLWKQEINALTKVLHNHLSLVQMISMRSPDAIAVLCLLRLFDILVNWTLCLYWPSGTLLMNLNLKSWVDESHFIQHCGSQRKGLCWEHLDILRRSRPTWLKHTVAIFWCFRGRGIVSWRWYP